MQFEGRDKSKTSAKKNDSKGIKKDSTKSRKTDKEDDFELSLKSFTKVNKTCFSTDCKEATSLYGLKCDLCGEIFCLSHLLPEVHGCTEAARRAARNDFLHPRRGISSQERTKLDKKLKKSISSLSEARKPKKK